MPLPNEGHLSAMMEGMPSNIPCGRIHQLKVHQLLHSEARVVYPEGLNRCLVPVITTLPESLSQGMTLLNDKSTLLQVDISQFMTEGHESKTPFLGGGSTSTSCTHPAMAPPPKVESQVSMTMDVSELLSQAVLDTSCQASGCSTPKRPVSLALGAQPSLRPESSAKPVDTSSQVSTQARIPDDAVPDVQTLDEISLPVKTSALGASVLPGDVIQLQEEAGKALGCLLATRSSLDACQRKQVLDFKMALCQNMSETTETIKEAKTPRTCTIREAEANQVMLISEAEAQHATCIKEAKETALLS